MSPSSALSTQTSRVVEVMRATYYTFFNLLTVYLGRSPALNYSLGSIMGFFRYHMGYIGANRSKRIYLDILSSALPHLSDQERKTILFQFWINHQKMLLELFMFNLWPQLYLDKRVTITGLEHIEQAALQGKGVILSVPHFGNERIVHLALGVRGYSVAVVTSSFEGAHPRVRKAKLKAAYQWNIVRFPDQNIRWMYRFLRKGGIVQLSPTAPGGEKDPSVDFLNHRVRMSAVPARLCQSTQAVLVPTFDYRLPDNTHRIVIHPPLEAPAEKTDKQGWHELSNRTMQYIEQAVLADPDQFYWMWLVIRSQEYTRWKANRISHL